MKFLNTNSINMSTETKRCSKCGRELPLSEFYSNKSKPDGHGCYCKECAKARQREYDSLKRVKLANAKHEEEERTRVETVINPVVKQQHVEAKEKTLNDFQPKEIIKYLYKLGYRIEDNRLVCYVKQTVNIKDIINA